jgi:hypothetical protein
MRVPIKIFNKKQVKMKIWEDPTKKPPMAQENKRKHSLVECTPKRKKIELS